MSTTEYIYKLIVAVPEPLIIPANHLSVAIGEGPGDFYCFGNLNYKDQNEIKYSVVCTAVTPLLFAYASNPLQHRFFAPEEWSIELATQAQLAVNLWFGPTENQPTQPQANANQILGIVGNDTFSIIDSMGLSRIDE